MKVFGRKMLFGSGESVSVVGITILGLYFLYFMTDVVGLSPALAGAIFMIGRGWDAISDPFIGVITDRTKTRWGRRRPFFLVAAVPLAIFFSLLWSQVGFDDQLITFLYYALFYILFMTSLTLFHVPYISLITEYSTDYDERTSINNYRIFFQLFFGLIAATIPKMIADQYGWSIMAMCVGIFLLTLALIMFGFTRENADAPKPETFKFKKEFNHLRQNRALKYLLWIYVGCYAAANIIEGFVIYYMKYWMNREFDMEILFVIVIGISILSLPVWAKLTKIVGKKSALIIGLFIWIAGQAGWLLVSQASADFVVYIIGVVVGIGYGVAHVLPWAMLPEVVDMDEYQTGARREGVYAGVMTFFMKITNSIAIFLIGVILELSGYTANEVQSETAMTTIQWTMSIAPGIFVIMALIATFLYPYTKDDHMNIRTELEKRGT
ncbi:MFS transporter [Virgibacillus salinus]|uniref:Glycoside/pentoside/hexuronide:cation symporter, GPH family/oligogalacturonide transporter n=1 Tax=Virgibacillus salinus TaxID=553311 RepID=A0A1H1EPS5_9BACI|nr:glycoside-pentoside-hexuronide (GPH):cation symporter [Virgibacillus salinus]SDQ90509.1 glycoside/pentoside/hexuronide:cation symporter, GPH family/oligogalacturonide transporter [Virgibacillus salinus]